MKFKWAGHAPAFLIMIISILFSHFPGYSFLDISRIRGPFWTLGVKPRASGGLVSYLREYPLEENPFLGGIASDLREMWFQS